MFRTSNPAFSRNEAFTPAQSWDDLRAQGRGVVEEPAVERTAIDGGKAMTVQGTVNKTFLLLAICVTTSLITWNLAIMPEPPVSAMLLMIGGAIAGLVISLVLCFAPKLSPIGAPLYAGAEGLFVGGISAFYAMRFATDPIMTVSTGAAASSAAQSGPMVLNTGLIMNAVLLTFGITAGLLAGYTTKLIRPGPVFRNAVVAGTIGVFFYGVIAMVASLFGSSSLISVYDPNNGGLVSLGFSALVVVLASANLVLDFDFIHAGARNRAPKYMEWYGAFGLMVTLVWLYIEVLRLLAKLRSAQE